MATISFSDSWMNLALVKVLSFGIGTFDTSAPPLFPNATASTNSSAGQLDIMQGSVPLDLSGLQNYSDRATDVLVSFRTVNSLVAGFQTQCFENTNNLFSSNAESVNPAIISTIYQPATATGTATWFRFMTLKFATSGQPPSGIWHQFIGTVSVVGSGGDLQMDDVNIITGTQYRVSGLQLAFPTTYTV